MPGIECDGKIVFTPTPLKSCDQLWFIARNQGHDNVIPLSNMWANFKAHKCTYDPLYMSKIHDLEKNIYFDWTNKK